MYRITAGLLARLLSDGLPIPMQPGQWQVVQKVFIKAYSCGYSSGFEPDSLFITYSWQGTGNTEKQVKDR